MNQKLEKIIEIPQGFTTTVNHGEITLKGNGKEIKKNFIIGKLDIAHKDNKITITTKKATRRELKNAGSIEAHIYNMIQGLNQDFVYKLEICNVHFPMTVKVDGNRFLIKTFLGEAADRIANILPNTKVEVKGTEVTVSSADVENAGQTAANIEIATKVKNRDRRVFQDGIFITSKPK